MKKKKMGEDKEHLLALFSHGLVFEEKDDSRVNLWTWYKHRVSTMRCWFNLCFAHELLMKALRIITLFLRVFHKFQLSKISRWCMLIP